MDASIKERSWMQDLVIPYIFFTSYIRRKEDTTMKLIICVLLYEALGVMWWIIVTSKHDMSLLEDFYLVFKMGYNLTGRDLASDLADGTLNENTFENILFVLILIDTLLLWPINLLFVNPIKNLIVKKFL